ncbi:MAG: hypothetical protein JW881_01410 [Spirochaetales bacterium]|nr:hypothetical protein [Spirochaetales bacterium]
MKKKHKKILVFLIILIFTGNAFGADPVNPNTIQIARNLLDYLYSAYGNHILSGQEECEWCGNPDQENEFIYQSSGKYPAIRGMDLLYRGSAMTGRAISWWNSGGILLIRWHMGAPNNQDTYEGSKASVSINQVLTQGTSEYNTFIQRLDSGAETLRTLQDNNIPVIYAPWHEAGDGCAWFWWAMEGGSQFLRLWNFMYDYYTNTKGLNNLIWMNPQCGTPSSAFFPGSSRCDLAGGDTYDRGIHADIYSKIVGFAGTSMPIALHECGYIPDPSQLQSQGVKFVLFNNWNNEFLTDQGASYINTVYNHSYVITRDELPDLRSGGSTSPPSGNKGDTNGDGTINIVDALLVAQYYVGLNPQNFVSTNADTNCSGGIDIVDALLVAQYYVGLISNFPC